MKRCPVYSLKNWTLKTNLTNNTKPSQNSTYGQFFIYAVSAGGFIAQNIMIYESVFEIEKLEQGYLIINNQKERIGINNQDDLEKRISNILEKEVKIKDRLYFNEGKKMKISLLIDFE
jgi:hypothetical protein